MMPVSLNGSFQIDRPIGLKKNSDGVSVEAALRVAVATLLRCTNNLCMLPLSTNGNDVWCVHS